MTKLSLRRFIIVTTLIVIVTAVQAGQIPVANHSFESPYVEPKYPYALPYVTDWIELDNDEDTSINTGVFYNLGGIADTDGNQLAFLDGELGNALMQDLSSVYQAGKSYRMTVGIALAEDHPSEPNGLELAFYYREPNLIDIATFTTPGPNDFSRQMLIDQSVYLPPVPADAPWVGKPIGIAIRADRYETEDAHWDLDNVRVTEYLVPNFTDDSIVNFADFALMAAEWLSCDEPFTDVTGEGCVDEQDLLILIQYWLGDV